MPEDQQQPPQPQPSEPQTPPPAKASGAADGTVAKVQQSLQQAWGQAQPILKTQTIKTLRATIRLLEGAVVELEKEPGAQTSPSAIGEQFAKLLAAIQAQLPRLQAFWQVVLQKTRSLLPENISQKLPDWGLSSAIAAIAFVVLWTVTSLLPGKPSPQVAQLPPTPAPAIAPAPVAVAPTPAISPTPAATAPAVPATPAPAELAAPSAAKPVEMAAPTPPPLTPEQSLIASLQGKVAEIASQYANGAIAAVETDAASSRIKVKINDSWYKLDRSEQDKVATQMWQRAKELEFAKLVITDASDRLIARSPVVGDSVIILQRRPLGNS